MAALARHVCLKAPDKADPRAAAIKAATDIAAELPSWEQDQMAGFAYMISRSNKVCLYWTAQAQLCPARIACCNAWHVEPI
jgi:hypothetical protein